MLLRDRAIAYQLWLAPWFGIMLAVIPMLWLSRLGVSAQWNFYLVTLLALSLVALCVLMRVPLLGPTRGIDSGFNRWLGAGACATLAVALYPMLSVTNAPTTFTFGNNDPALYAVASDFLRSHSITQLPPANPLIPSSNLLRYMLSPGHRPGAFLILLLFQCLLHVPFYRVFSIALALFLALTTPLIAIFTEQLSGKRWCALIALALGAVNVNFLYCFYQGFAAQILIQGCIIATFILVLVDKQQSDQQTTDVPQIDQPDAVPPLSHSIAIGVAIIAMILLVPEGGAFFLLPYVLYAAMQAALDPLSPGKLLRRYGPVALVLAVGTIPLWQGLVWVRGISTERFGWDIPDWAMPINIIGLMSAVGFPHRSIIPALCLSIPVVIGIVWGIIQSRDRALITALVVFNVVVLIYFRAFRHYSYAYYKAAVMAGFVFIAAFATGFRQLPDRCGAVACVILAIVSLAISRPTIANMCRYRLEVTRDMSGLGEIQPALIRGRVISLDQLSLWERFWTIDFLPGAALTAPEPFFSVRTPASLALVYRSGAPPLSKDEVVIWSNGRYALTRKHQ